ncbi:MAG: TraM recognition domain-containing protein [Solirubrobacteraceae bacterium]
MTDEPAPPSRRPYWLLPVLVVLLVIPHAWAVGALVAGVAGASLRGAVRRARTRRATVAAGLGSSDSIVLGVSTTGEPVVLSDRQLSAHGLILGASGAGKSTTLLAILTDHVRRGRPVVAIDMKGSPAFAAELARAAAQSGRPFRLWTPDGPGHWNPLQHGNATELKDKLIATERFTEPHYQRAAERYVQTALQVLQAGHPERSPTLGEVVRMMDPRALSGELRRVPRPLAQRVQDYVAGLTSDQLSAIRGLGTRLAIISESHTGQYLSPSAAGPRGADDQTVDVRRGLAGNEVILFSLNSSRYGKLAAQLGTLVIQDLVSAVGNRLTLAEGDHALIGVDEFSALGADNVISLLARGREAGISLLLATQELADLDRAARGLRDQVLGNTAVKIVHRQDVPSSAQTVAQMAGTKKAWEHTYQVGQGPLLGRYDTGRGTRRQVEQFVVHPNEIRSLRTGDAVLITKLPKASARTVHVARPRAREGPELG